MGNFGDGKRPSLTHYVVELGEGMALVFFYIQFYC